MCKELQSPVLPLFVRVPNGSPTVMGRNKDLFQINPSACSPLHMRLYEFTGKLMGIAARGKASVCVRALGPSASSVRVCVCAIVLGVPEWIACCV